MTAPKILPSASPCGTESAATSPEASGKSQDGGDCPTYLWGWKREHRHIAKPRTGFDIENRLGWPLCPSGFTGRMFDRGWHEESILLRRRPRIPADVLIARLDTVPVCRHCLTKQPQVCVLGVPEDQCDMSSSGGFCDVCGMVRT